MSVYNDLEHGQDSVSTTGTAESLNVVDEAVSCIVEVL